MVFLATQWHQHYRYYLLLVSFGLNDGYRVSVQHLQGSSDVKLSQQEQTYVCLFFFKLV